jgi:uncharacterized membrane protein
MLEIINEVKKIQRTNLLLVLFLFGYTFFILYLCYYLNIWDDELYSLHTSSNNLLEVIRQSYSTERQAPFYFLLLALWRTINSGVFFARLLSPLCIAFGAFIFYKIVRFVLDIENSRWLLLVFLLNPYTIWAALEIRLYAFAIFLSTLLIYTIMRFYKENKKKYLWWFLIISLIGLYTQYYFSFLIFAIGILVLLFKGFKEFIKLSLYLTIVVLLFIPNLFILEKLISVSQTDMIGYSFLGSLKSVLYGPQNLMLGYFVEPFTVKIRWMIKVFFALLLIISYYILYRQRHKSNDEFFKFINGTIIVVFILLALYGIFIPVSKIYFGVRHMAVAFPMLLLLFTLFKVFPVFYKRMIYIVIVVFFTFLLIKEYKNPVKDFDYKSGSKYTSYISK